MARFKRILLKLSGESLQGNQGYGIDSTRLQQYAEQIKAAHDLGIEIGIVIGGGNIFRGLQGAAAGFDRVTGDQMGMCATVINSLAIASALSSLGVAARVLTATRMEPVGEYYSRQKAVELLSGGTVVVMAGGTGNPFFTTDSGAALRGREIGADVVLKGTRVDGVYTADPERDSSATKFASITFDEVLSRNLHVMDLTAITLCREGQLPIYVFNMDKPGNLLRVLQGQDVGTLVH